MNLSDSSKTSIQTERRNRRLGVLLFCIGLVAFLAQLRQYAGPETLALTAFGLVFLLLGIVYHRGGLLVAGGILSGIGVGLVLQRWGMYRTDMDNSALRGLFLVAFAVGWGLITLLSACFTKETYWWALVPGALTALVGIALLVGGPAEVAILWLSRIWPAALLCVGAYLIWRNRHPGRTRMKRVIPKPDENITATAADTAKESGNADKTN